jgi:hypothetical protein
MTRHLNPKAFSRAIEILQQADELLKIFAKTDWEKLPSQHKVAAGLLGKWICDRCLRVFGEATGREIPASADLLSLLNSSGLRNSLPAEHIAALENVERYVGSPEPGEPGWETDYEKAYIVAHGVRSIALQTLVLVNHR